MPLFEIPVFGRNISQMNLRAPPTHLSSSAAQWWKSTVETYVLSEHHLRLLQLACEAWDQCQAARAQLAREGMTVTRDDGSIRSHPCVVIERDARLAVARLVRELDLDVEPPVSDRDGPPGLLSNRGNHARKVARS
jgi:P27 family predicted phage terminase small subunit